MSSAVTDFVGQIFLIVLLVAVGVFVIVVLVRAIRIIPQAYAGVVERLGRYHKTLTPGLNILVPFIDRVRPLVDMREQVVSFPPQPVITEDNLVVSIDTVVYFQVTDARAATYEIASYLGAVEQLTTTTLRNVVGGLNLEEALTSREEVNSKLRIVLDEATGKWGIRVSRVELKAIDPPVSIQDSMEKQMRAERDRRAAILTAEGTKQSAILEAEGRRQASILKAEGDAKAAVLRAQGEAEAITTVFDAIHRGDPDPKLLAYQYLQMLPEVARGDANKLWIVPSELTEALKGVSSAFGAGRGTPRPAATPRRATDRADAAGGTAPSGARAPGAGARCAREHARSLPCGAHDGHPHHRDRRARLGRRHRDDRARRRPAPCRGYRSQRRRPHGRRARGRGPRRRPRRADARRGAGRVPRRALQHRPEGRGGGGARRRRGRCGRGIRSRPADVVRRGPPGPRRARAAGRRHVAGLARGAAGADRDVAAQRAVDPSDAAGRRRGAGARVGARREDRDPRFVRRVQAAGAEVHVWTINDPADMRRLLALGVDGIVTDRADLAMDVLRERSPG
ncbi:hypothetical protein GCM10025877_33040 [Agromyces mangrovi Wang et al. 2018]|nr:hypothetical protein GCM10025877_33040 [Agromyces mangrovi]